MTYHPHIDGLRAVAVLSVILFHLGFEQFSGGFVGVDVFFVISGFLITRIIVNEVSQTGSFAFANFYIRRARRLLPAMLATLVVTTAVVVPLYSSSQLESYAYELIAGLVSLANLLFWNVSGYFDTAAESKTLLHMWSLSVEEQFYLIWPLVVLIAVIRFTGLWRAVFFTLIFTVSLVAAVALTHIDLVWFQNQSEALFFLTPFRVYEFMIGAAGVWLVERVEIQRAHQELLSLLGLVAVLISVLGFDSRTPFPYVYALLPCIGTLLLILSGRSRLSRYLLANPAAVFIGLISYTLYLVHWPVIVVLRHLHLDGVINKSVWLAIALTTIISLIIYYAVERPLRRPAAINREKLTVFHANRRFLAGCASTLMLTVAVGLLVIQTAGFSGYKSELFSQSQVKLGKLHRYKLTGQACTLREEGRAKCDFNKPVQVLVYGNSHEPDGYNIMSEVLSRRSDVNLILFGGTNFCEIHVNESGEVVSKVKKRECHDRIKSLNSQVVERLNYIVYSSNKPFSENKDGDWRAFDVWKSLNPKLELIVIGSYFNTAEECTEVANRVGSLDACKASKYLSHAGKDEFKTRRAKRVSKGVEYLYLDKFKAACAVSDQAYESCAVAADGEPMYYDQHHLSLSFAQFIGRRFKEVYVDQLRQNGLLVEPNN
jgi:peptidoglycan/LPS O-acetylase OafA/YrhL